MKETLYLTKEGILYRKDNTIYFQNKQIKKAIPIQSLRDIFCLNQITIRSGAMHYLLKEQIPVHIFGRYGTYRGTLYPKEGLISGKVIVEQVEHAKNMVKRLKIVKEMFEGIKHNILYILNYYQKKGRKISQHMQMIKSIELEEIPKSVNVIRSKEGQMWNEFYKTIDEICIKWKFEKRTRQPPENEINSLISYGNSLLYAKILSELYHTYLHPAISFIHEPRERRFSLVLDIADIFKPVIVYRTIFRLINGQIMKKEHFEETVGVLLNEQGRGIFLNEFEKTLKTTLKHNTLKRKVSYQYLLRLEGYKLMKHVMGDKKYESMKAWW